MTKDQKFLVDFDHTLYDVTSTSLYPDAVDFIQYLKKYGEPILFSEGEIDFQKLKIEKNKMRIHFGENIKIFPSYTKMSGIKDITNDKFAILFDDKPEIIDKAIRLGYITVRVKRGKYKDLKTKNKPNLEVSSLSEIIEKDLLSKL